MQTVVPYFTIVLTYTAINATIWHPTDSTGAFSTLTRGAFDNLAALDSWAKKNIPGHEYAVKVFEKV